MNVCVIGKTIVRTSVVCKTPRRQRCRALARICENKRQANERITQTSRQTAYTLAKYNSRTHTQGTGYFPYPRTKCYSPQSRWFRLPAASSCRLNCDPNRLHIKPTTHILRGLVSPPISGPLCDDKSVSELGFSCARTHTCAHTHTHTCHTHSYIESATCQQRLCPTQPKAKPSQVLKQPAAHATKRVWLLFSRSI